MRMCVTTVNNFTPFNDIDMDKICKATPKAITVLH